MKQLEKFKDLDPEEYKALKEEVTLLKKNDAGGDEKKIQSLIDAAVEDAKKRADKVINDLSSKFESVAKRNQHLEIVVPALQKLSPVVNEDQIELMTSLVERDLTLVDGQIRVKDKDGKPIPSEVNPREDMGLDEYITTLQGKYPSSFKSTAVPGGKSGETRKYSASGTGVTPEKYMSMSAAERQKLPPEQRQNLAAQAIGMPRRITQEQAKQ
jgi:histidinol dehydrogenase